MGSYICPITGLPIQHGEPVVALLLTAARSRVTSQIPATSLAEWVPRTIPVFGTCDADTELQLAPSPLLDLWTEGLRIDAVPRSAPKVGRASSLTDFLQAIGRGRLFVKDIEHVGEPHVDPGTPTIPRVRTMVDGTKCGWTAMRRVVFPYVEAVAYSESDAATELAVDHVTRLAEARGWYVRVAPYAGLSFSRKVTFEPRDVADAVRREAVRRDPYFRAVRSVALLVCSRSGWRAMLANPMSISGMGKPLDKAFIRKRIREAQREWHQNVSLFKGPDANPTHNAAQRRARDAGRLRNIAAMSFRFLFGGFDYLGSIDVGWSVSRVLDLGRLGAWSKADVDAAMDALAELVVVDRALVEQSRGWAPSRWTVDVTPWRAWASVAERVAGEARRRGEAERARLAQIEGE